MDLEQGDPTFQNQWVHPRHNTALQNSEDDIDHESATQDHTNHPYRDPTLQDHINHHPTVQGQGTDINRHYDGGYHFYKGRSYRNPIPKDVGRSNPVPPEQPFHHRDYLGRLTFKTQDLARYISSTYAKPFHLIVQATPKAFDEPQGEWRRASLKANARTVIRLANWAVGDLGDPRCQNMEEYAIMWSKVFLVLPLEVPLLLREILAKLPVVGPLFAPFLSRSGRISETYPIFFSRSWDYPRYPRNLLDASPDYNRRFRIVPTRLANGNAANRTRHEAEEAPANAAVPVQGVPYDRSGDLERLIKPRKLMIRQDDGAWELSDGTSKPYVVISYVARSFGVDRNTNSHPEIEQIAERMAIHYKCCAYWVDYKCRASLDDPEELTRDVHRICDVFRGAVQVIVLLPDLSIQEKQCWGQRMWCLPEALLCSQQKIVFCSVDGSYEEYTKIQLAAEVWMDGGSTTRLLAEHYTGLLTLSRLEIISLGLEALNFRRDPGREWHQADLAFALMSLLRYRPRVDKDATLFQTLARLSLANDSDRIVERAVCLLPHPTAQRHSDFVLDDALGAKLWDIEPLCQVAGVGDNNEVFLDGCQAASIRWKDVPRIYFHGRSTWKKGLQEFAWQTSSIWFLIGLILIIAGGKSTPYGADGPSDPNFLSAGIVIFLLGFGMMLRLPWEIQRIYSGKVWGTTPWLIGFEGVLPLRDIERIFFGNCAGRLRYAPSSGLYQNPDEFERLGKPPPWTEDPNLPEAPVLPQHHRWFTLVDTGPSMHVHVFSARMPPTVALICGKEGGMLRVVLCSYEAKGNLLRKETVLRMETPMLSLTKMQSWIRFSQGW